MSVDQYFLEKVMSSQNISKFVLDVDGKEFNLFNVSIMKSPTPVRRPTTRGGVYFSDTSAYKIRCSVSGHDIVSFLSSKMLGPSTDFEELSVTVLQNDSIYGKIFGILTNSMQAKDHTELNLIIVNTVLG